MTRTAATNPAFLAILACCAHALATQPEGGRPIDASPSSAKSPFVLGPPRGDGPVVVKARFDLHDVNAIDDEAETFEFSGVMTLTWHDPRQAFDPATEGVNEKIFQGGYQVNEISPGWFPQVVLVNDAGTYQNSGVVLRVLPDGTSTQIETLNAVAEAKMNMRRFPFDGHRLEAVFEVLGFDKDEVVLEVADAASQSWRPDIQIPEWTVSGISLTVRDRPQSYAGRRGVSSVFALGLHVQRESFYVSRLIVIPLTLIVLLSFSVFWMDRSSLGDRINISFIGILTGVAYQFLMSQNLPRISYVTLMHAFLNLSFITMCATVVINLVVGAMDRHGKVEAGKRLDRRCRWLFPLVYFGLNVVLLVLAYSLP